MGSRAIVVVFHVATLIYYGYTDHITMEAIEDVHIPLGRSADDPELKRWIRGTPFYFTFWNLVIHQIYFTICCLEHLSTVFPKLANFLEMAKRVRRTILTSVFIPSAFLVAVNYWVATCVVPKLVFEEFLGVFPWWVNHSFHTYVVPIAIFELYLCASSDWISELGKPRGWKILNSYITVYSLATIIYKFTTDAWPYPFFDHMTIWMRACFVVQVYASAWFWYYIATKLAKNVFGKKSTRRAVAMANKHKRF